MSWVAAGTAAVSIGGSLLSKPKSSSSSTKDPAYLQDAKQSALGRADTLSKRTQDQYGGDRIAGISNNEQSALDIAAGGSEDARSNLNKAGSQLDAASGMDFKKDVGSYMNPYVESVLQPQLREQNREYDREKTALTNSKGGAWGGDRSAFAASELEKNHREGIADVTGKTYSEAFDAATKNFFNDSQRKQDAATSYERLGSGFQNLETQDIQNLMSTGGTQRLLKQAGLDVNYQNFIETRDWDVNNLDTLLKAIGTASGNTTTTTTGSKPGIAGQVLGAGATLAGMYFGGKSTINPVDISNTTKTFGTGTAAND